MIDDNRARTKFLAIQSLRWTGLLMVGFGLLILYGKVDLPEVIGYVLVPVGLVDALIMPTILSRMWRTRS